MNHGQNFNPAEVTERAKHAYELATKTAGVCVELAKALDISSARLDALEQTNQSLARTIMQQAGEKVALERRIAELEQFTPILRAKFAAALGPAEPEILPETVERYKNGERESRVDLDGMNETQLLQAGQGIGTHGR